MPRAAIYLIVEATCGNASLNDTLFFASHLTSFFIFFIFPPSVYALRFRQTAADDLVCPAAKSITTVQPVAIALDFRWQTVSLNISNEPKL